MSLIKEQEQPERDSSFSHCISFPVLIYVPVSVFCADRMINLDMLAQKASPSITSLAFHLLKGFDAEFNSSVSSVTKIYLSVRFASVGLIFK